MWTAATPTGPGPPGLPSAHPRLPLPNRLAAVSEPTRVKGARALSGPGDGPAVPPSSPATQGLLPDEPLAGVAARHGLTPSAARPRPGIYLKQLWQRRHFVLAFATARNIAMYSEARLGQVWQILTPLLNAAVYFLIFGVILDTRRGVPNFIAFLVTGIFIFNFTQRSFIIASRVINDTRELIRALHFPRACLPLGYIVIELQQMLVSMVVLIVIVLATGEPITWYWLMVVPVIALQTLFNVGVGFLLARIGAGVEDVSQLIPFIVRTWMYASGVMFFIPALSTLYLHAALSYLMQINPAAVYIELVRNSLLTSLRQTVAGYRPYNRELCAVGLHQQARGVLHPALLNSCHLVVGNGSLWLYGVGWAVAAIVVGYFVFWQAEMTYGRG
jgi:teichoic acid transport system permease protein